jgi:hypothetical protein
VEKRSQQNRLCIRICAYLAAVGQKRVFDTNSYSHKKVAQLMYRLIIKLEWLIGFAFVVLAIPTFVHKIRLFDDVGVVVLVLAVALTILFFLGAFIAPEDKILAVARPNPYHRDLSLLSATFGVVGFFPLVSDFSICNNGRGRLCGVLKSVAEPLGFSDIDFAISVVTLLISLFFGIYGYRFYRSGIER